MSTPADVRRRWTTGLIALVVVVLVGLVALALRGDEAREDAAGPTSPASAATVSPTTSPAGSPTAPGPSPSALEPTASPSGTELPLPDLLVSRFDGASSVVSDTPTSDTELQDGSFFAILHDVDAQARTVSVDVAIFLGGDAARAWLAEHDPDRAAQGLENGYLTVNDVERIRVVPFSPQVRVATWCWGGDGMTLVERDVAEWAAAAPTTATTSCDEPGRQGNPDYWLDVRDGVVVQIAGQYLP